MSLTIVSESADTIVVRVPVDRTLNPQQALDVTGHEQCINSNVLKTMPRGEGDEVEVVFFKLGRNVSDVDLDKEYELRGLKPADPYSLAAINAADPAFADEKPNCTHWKNSEDEWRYVTFYVWSGGRGLHVRPRGSGWYGIWWFAGIRCKAT